MKKNNNKKTATIKYQNQTICLGMFIEGITIASVIAAWFVCFPNSISVI
jgi:hypothetical protein